MQGLCPPERSCHCFNRSPHNVVIWIHGSQADTRGLAVCAQHQRTTVFWLKFLLHKRGPEQPGRFHEKVHTDSKKERDTRCKGIHVKTTGNSGAHILNSVSDGKCQFLST